MRPFLLAGVLSVVLAGRALAQSEPQELEATSVAVVQVPPTQLDVVDGSNGLTVRTLTRIGELTDDTGNVLSVYAVAIEVRQAGIDAKTLRRPPTAPPTDAVRGLAVVVTPRGGRPVRAYVDADAIANVTGGLDLMATADRGGGPGTEVRGVYRYGNLAVYQYDDAGGRSVAVRTLQVAPITGQAAFAVARFRSVRLADVLRLLRQGEETLNKGK